MKKFLSYIVFSLHVALIIFWYGLFFVPKSWWPEKIVFHFLLTLFIVSHQFLWGLIIMPWTKKYRMVCALTTLTQLLRDQQISNPKNYDHSFTREFFGKVGINVSHRGVTVITLAILIIVTIQYFIN